MLRKHLEGNYPGIISNPFTPKIDQFQISPAVSYQKYYITQYEELGKRLPYGLVVRIPGFHPGGPGSIPGVGTLFFLVLLHSPRAVRKIFPRKHVTITQTRVSTHVLFTFHVSTKF